MARRILMTVCVAALTAPCLAATAHAASAGETFLTSGLTLPAGALAGGTSGTSGSGSAPLAVSANGRYVAFVANADTLSPAAHRDVSNVFRKDRLTGEVVLVSRANGANGAGAARNSSEPAISDDGARVSFVTDASLDPADADGGVDDVYVRDLAAGTTVLATPGTDEDVRDHDLSGDGAYVAFSTESALVAGDGNGVMDVYVRDLDAATTALVSWSIGGTAAGNGPSSEPSISGDGRWIAFASSATNISLGYVGTGQQIYVRFSADRSYSSGVATLVSNRDGVAAAGGNGYSSEPVIAGAPDAPGAVAIAYTSSATDIGGGSADLATDPDIYLRRLSTTASVLVSRADGPSGASADSRAHTPSISDDGQRVVFASDATNLGGAPDGYYGVYVRDLATSRTVLGSVDNDYSVQGAIAGDGSAIAWVSGHGLTADADPGLYGAYARAYGPPLGAPELVGRPPGSAPFLATEASVLSDGGRTISGDGRYVVFSASSHLLPGGGGGRSLVYRRDTRTGATELVSRATGPGGAPAAGDEPSISADGTRVAFVSDERLDPAAVADRAAVYVRDLAAGTTILAARADGPGGAASDEPSERATISADGRHVVFVTDAGNLGAPAGTDHVYVRDLAAARTTLVDRADGAGGAIADGDGQRPSISADGRLVAFASWAGNLDPADADGVRDVYVRDLVAGTTRLVSRRSGADGAKGRASSYAPALSGDGRVVAFVAEDDQLAPEAGAWTAPQVVARDLATGANTLVSRAPGGAAADRRADDPAIDGDGDVIAFASSATNLLPGRGGEVRSAVFARTLANGALTGPPAFGLVDNEPQQGARTPSLSDDGQCLAFTASGHVDGSALGSDVYAGYVFVVSGACPKPAPAGPAPPLPPVDGGGGGTPVRTVRAPVLRRVSVKPARFRVGKRATAKTARGAKAATRRKAKAPRRKAKAPRRAKARGKRARRTPVGTTFRFTIDARANVTIAFTRRAVGRKAGKRCRKPVRKLRHKPRCVRWVKVGALKRTGVDPGSRQVAFSGRVGRKALRPGTYSATVRATNAGGASKRVRVQFKVVRR